jgi:hypothetical protein
MSGRAFATVLMLFWLAACKRTGISTEPRDGAGSVPASSDARDGSDGAGGGAPDVSGADVKDGPPDVGGSDTRDGAPGFCNADSPCGVSGISHFCVDATHYRRAVSHDCSFICGAVPCSGGSCDPDGPVMACDPGTVCVNQMPGGQADAGPACQPPPDGGDAGGADADAAGDVSAGG